MGRRSLHIWLVAFVLIHSVSSLTVQTTRGRQNFGAYHYPSSTITKNVDCLDLKHNVPPREGMALSLSTSSSAPGHDYAGSNMSRVKAFFTKCGMVSYIASMCVALPISLLPPVLLHRIKLISTTRKERLSLRAGQFCSRWLMRVFPFANVKVMKHTDKGTPEPTIWVCNHTSMLDIFVLLATDKKLRGRKKRPIKIIYWKELERNPITRILFKNCGFIPVEMEDNGNGNANSYNKGSFKAMLKSIKKAFDDGFDIGILPEGQLNPSPEDGLLPIFPGAFTLARMSKRPIRMMGIHGLHRLWYGDDLMGSKVTGRKVKVRAYPFGQKFSCADEFVESFKNVIGHFGARGEDLPGWEDWMNGKAWSKIEKKKQSEVE